MQSYIRRLGEGFDGLRALMKFALPLLIKVSASKAVLVIRVWGSRSDLSCHQLESTSHRTVGYPFITNLCRPTLDGFVTLEAFDKP
jgi:hypothetical protein